MDNEMPGSSDQPRPPSQWRAEQEWRAMYEKDSLSANPFTHQIREGIGDIDTDFQTPVPDLPGSDPDLIRDPNDPELIPPADI